MMVSPLWRIVLFIIHALLHLSDRQNCPDGHSSFHRQTGFDRGPVVAARIPVGVPDPAHGRFEVRPVAGAGSSHRHLAANRVVRRMPAPGLERLDRPAHHELPAGFPGALHSAGNSDVCGLVAPLSALPDRAVPVVVGHTDRVPAAGHPRRETAGQQALGTDVWYPGAPDDSPRRYSALELLL